MVIDRAVTTDGALAVQAVAGDGAWYWGRPGNAADAGTHSRAH